MGGEHEGWGELGGDRAERDAKDRIGFWVMAIPAPLSRSEQVGRVTSNFELICQ